MIVLKKINERNICAKVVAGVCMGVCGVGCVCGGGCVCGCVKLYNLF